MKYILFIIVSVIIFSRFHWYVYVKGVNNNWLRYGLFSILSSVIIAILQLHLQGHSVDVKKDYLMSATAIFTAYIAIFIFYPIIRNLINSHS